MSDSNAIVVNEPTEQAQETQQEISILLQKIMGQDNVPSLSDAQISELLAQRREIANYIHEDKKRESYDAKFLFVGVLTFVLIFSALVLWKKPDVFSEVLSLIVGLLGGGAGGYTFGKWSK